MVKLLKNNIQSPHTLHCFFFVPLSLGGIKIIQVRKLKMQKMIIQRMNNKSKRRWVGMVTFAALLFLLFLPAPAVFAVCDLSTNFKIYVPPNNKDTGGKVFLVITAFSDKTVINVVDEMEDGDEDDSFSNVNLNAGQSFIVAFSEGSVNDDSRGKWDGDYFTITSNHPVSVMQATLSTYEHDWLPAENKTMRGKKFIFYNPESGDSPNEVNLFAYTNGTDIAIYDITSTPLLSSGTSAVNWELKTLLLTTSLEQGEDLISIKGLGINLLEAGHTYVVLASKPVTAQFGALVDEPRDGGGFVPSANGSAVGDLFYFYVPGEPKNKEIRILSFEDNAQVRLSGWNNGNWTLIQEMQLDELDHADWVSNAEGYELFKLVSTTGENVSVFESNWLETSNEPGTADITTFATSEFGYGAGTRFICYMPPPGDESFVTNQGTRYSHLFLYGHYPKTNVQIFDTDSHGSKIIQNIQLEKDQYFDFRINVEKYNSIYNGDGNPKSGPDRPYLTVVSDHRIAVMITDWNDNWFTFGTGVLLPLPKIKYSVNPVYIDQPVTAVFYGILDNFGDAALSGCEMKLTLPDGVEYLTSTWPKGDTATIEINAATGVTTIIWDNFNLSDQEAVSYSITARVTDIDKGQPFGTDKAFFSNVVAGGYSQGDYYETSDHAAIFVSQDVPLLPPINLEAVAGNHIIKVEWERSPSEDVVGYHLFRSLNSAIGFEKINQNLIVDTTFVDYNVTNGLTYYYYVVAVNSLSEQSAQSNIDDATPTDEQPGIMPPVLLSAIPDSANKSIELIWTILSKQFLNGFRLYRSETSGAGYVKIAELSKDDTSYVDTQIDYNQRYYYVVKAYDTEASETEYSNELSIFIKQIIIPVLVRVTPDSMNKSIEIIWTVSYSDELTAFSVYRRSINDTVYRRMAYLPVSDTTYVDYLVVCNHEYYYVIQAHLNDGTATPNSNELSTRIYQLPVPQLLEIIPDSVSKSIRLNWTIEYRLLIRNFNIYRKDSLNGDFNYLGQVLSVDTSYVDTQVEFGRKYYYVITAIDLNGAESLFSNILVTQMNKSISVQLVSALPDSESCAIQLSWTVTSTVNVLGFVIYRSDQSGSGYEAVGAVNSAHFAYPDQTAACNQTYYYAVTCILADGTETPVSNELPVVNDNIFSLSLLQILPDSASKAIKLVWAAYPSTEIIGYGVYRSEQSGAGYQQIAQVDTSDTTFIDVTVNYGKTYYYVVTALFRNGSETEYSNELFANIEQAAVLQLLQVTSDSTAKSMRIVWSVTNRTGILSFGIYRGETSGVGFQRIAQVVALDTFYLDLAVDYGTRYYYVVSIFFLNGTESPYSNELSGMINLAPTLELLQVLPDSAQKALKLFWTASRRSELNKFGVYRSDQSGSGYASIAQVLAVDTVFMDFGVNYNQDYFYVVTAYDNQNKESAYSNEISGNIFSLPTPVLLTVTPDSVQNALNLKWKVSFPEVITGFRLYRSTDGENFEFLAEQLKDSLIFTDTEIQPGVRYIYAVTGLGTAGQESPFSNTLCGMIIGEPETKTGNDIIYSYPNPCEDKDCEDIHFRFQLQNDAQVSIRIFDLAGDFVHELNGEAVAGQYGELVWNIVGMGSDVYIVIFQAKEFATNYEFRQISKIAIIK